MPNQIFRPSIFQPCLQVIMGKMMIYNHSIPINYSNCPKLKTILQLFNEKFKFLVVPNWY